MIAIEQPHARWLNLLWGTVSMNRVYDVEYGELPIRKLDAYFPENNSFATTVYFHGGGLEAGDKADKNYVDEKTRFTKMLILFGGKDMPCRLEQNTSRSRVLKTLNKNADIKRVRLEGGHCRGASEKGADGEYAFVKETLRWLEEC